MIIQAEESKIIPDTLREGVLVWEKLQIDEDPSIVDNESKNKMRNNFKWILEHSLIELLKPYVTHQDIGEDSENAIPGFLFNLIPTALEIFFKDIPTDIGAETGDSVNDASTAISLREKWEAIHGLTLLVRAPIEASDPDSFFRSLEGKKVILV